MRVSAALAAVLWLGGCGPSAATPSREAAPVPSPAVRAVAEGASLRVEAGDVVAVRLPSDSRDWGWSATGDARLEERASDDPAVVRLAVAGAGRAEARFRRKDGGCDTLKVVIESR